MRIVTAAVIMEDGRLFLCRRPPGKPLSGYWELPGGKQEPGESLETCLTRELLEELDMQVELGSTLASVTHQYEHGEFEIVAIAATRISGYQLLHHDDACWVDLRELPTLHITPADVELLSQLYPITPQG